MGIDFEDIGKVKLSDNLREEKYSKFLVNLLNNIYPKVKPGGHLCFIIGDSHGKNNIESIWESIQFRTKFKIKEIYWDENYLQTRKTTNMLNKKKGLATKIEKVLVLIKND